LEDASSSQDEQQLEPPESVLEVAKRAQAAKWEVEWVPLKEAPPRLVVGLPNGRDQRPLAVGSRRAEQLLTIPFEQFRVLGDYLAINNTTESYFEALIRPSSRFVPLRVSLIHIPGTEIIRNLDSFNSEDSDEVLDSTEEVSTAIDRPGRVGPYDRWKLRISDESKPWSIEFSEASTEFAALTNDISVRRYDDGRRSLTTLKIFGLSTVRHDEALRQLEDVSGAIFFELDLRYSALYELSHYQARRPSRPYRQQRIEQPPLLPRFRYPPEALNLYHYGRSAYGMPLLQFLAFYQVLEFFFPQHFRRHLLQRLRQELMEPRFDVGNDSHLTRILSLASTSGRGNASEREQLKATINACIDESTLRGFLEEDPDRLELLGDKKRIKGIPVLETKNRAASLLDQTAERIYALRCRIVHTKGDGADTIADLLLPSGPEAAALDADVDLVQFLAQKAIIAGGSAIN
jgi:hypothetical protein